MPQSFSKKFGINVCSSLRRGCFGDCLVEFRKVSGRLEFCKDGRMYRWESFALCLKEFRVDDQFVILTTYKLA